MKIIRVQAWWPRTRFRCFAGLLGTDAFATVLNCDNHPFPSLSASGPDCKVLPGCLNACGLEGTILNLTPSLSTGSMCKLRLRFIKAAYYAGFPDRWDPHLHIDPI